MNIDSVYRGYLSEYNNKINYYSMKDKENINNINSKDSFKDIITSEINKLNDKQVQADIMTSKFIVGDIESVHDVLIASEEARLYLELAVQVRNKLIEAYKELSNMQI